MSLKVVFITGANGSLGQAIAQAFLAESPDNFTWLAVHSRRERAEEMTRKNPDRCRCVPLDVTSRESWQKAITEILGVHARLDVLINNAGAHEDALLGTMPVSTWDRVLATNLDSVFHGCQAVLPAMISQRSGRIINIASLSALLAPAGQTNYAAAKAGVLALTRSLAKEVGRIGITVNAVCPGYLDTEALAMMGEVERQRAREQIPMRRFGQPREVAAAVRFLACAEAGYITGSALKIDGGIL